MVYAKLVELYRYPVKGLSGEAMEVVTLASGETLPFDRAYAIENGPGAFDEAAPRHLPKVAFLCLMRDEQLARLQTTFDTNSMTLTLSRDGLELACGDLSTSEGRVAIEAFLAREMAASLRGRLRVVSAARHSLF